MEANRKKQKAASNFASFFVSKKQEIRSTEEENIVEVKYFMPFEIKTDMKVAPVCRRTLNQEEKLFLDEKCNVWQSDLYLDDIKKQNNVPRNSHKTWPIEAKDDVILIGN